MGGGVVAGVSTPSLSMSLKDVMTYASITSVSWKYEAGCGAGDVRTVWGDQTDPVAATVVLASCVPDNFPG